MRPFYQTQWQGIDFQDFATPDAPCIAKNTEKARFVGSQLTAFAANILSIDVGLGVVKSTLFLRG